jgi:hypothetical protein
LGKSGPRFPEAFDTQFGGDPYFHGILVIVRVFAFPEFETLNVSATFQRSAVFCLDAIRIYVSMATVFGID